MHFFLVMKELRKLSLTLVITDNEHLLIFSSSQSLCEETTKSCKFYLQSKIQTEWHDIWYMKIYKERTYLIYLMKTSSIRYNQNLINPDYWIRLFNFPTVQGENSEYVEGKQVWKTSFK